MSTSTSRKIRRQLNKHNDDLQEKIQKVIQVGYQLEHVSDQIREVNGKLRDLDGIIIELNKVRNLVVEAIQVGRATHMEQARQRYVTLKMFEAFALKTPESAEEIRELEEDLRKEFDEAHIKAAEPLSEPSAAETGQVQESSEEPA